MHITKLKRELQVEMMIWTFFCRKIIRKNSKSSYFLLNFLQDRKRSSARNILELEKNLLFRADSTAPRRFLIYFFNGVCSFSFVKWPQESTCSFEGVPGALMAWGDCNGLWEVGEGLLDHFWACHILMPPWHAVVLGLWASAIFFRCRDVR